MIRYNKINNTLGLEQKLTDKLDLNNMNKGSVTKDYKIKSSEQRWFSAKKHSNKNSSTYENSDSDIYIGRDSLIQMSCKKGIH